MPQEKMKPSSAKSSSAGLEKRKHSQKGSQSAKTSPSREIAPFFSIFYRGITKINRSQSRAEFEKEAGPKGGTTQQQIGEQQQQDRMDRTTQQSSRKFADKPPLPSSKSKGTAVADGGDQRRGTHTGHISSSRSRSTVELAKEKAAAEGKKWREVEPSSSTDLRTIKKVNSAPNSPQSGRHWPFGKSRKQKAQSQEPPPPPSPQLAQQTGHMEGGRGEFNAHRNEFIFDDANKLNLQQKQSEIGFQTFRPLSSSQPSSSQQKLPQSPSSMFPLSFAQRIKLHKGVRTGKIPVDALRQASIQHNGGHHFVMKGTNALEGSGDCGAVGRTTASHFGGGKKSIIGKNKGSSAIRSSGPGVYMSVDAIHELSQDPDYIAEALRTLGDEQPKVARSTPKHAYISQDPKRIQDRLRRDCLYSQDVYDKMVKDSLLICDLLQTHLDDVIHGVRAKSPTALSSPFATPPGSPFMTRSTSMHIPGTRNTTGINRVTISVSPMAQQANSTTNPSPRPSQCSLPPPFPTNYSISPPLVRVIPASFRSQSSQFGFPPSSDQHLKIIRY